jgi:hypothetical protein
MHSTCFRQGTFSPWGWGTWKDRFVELEANWVKEENRNLSWDTHIRDSVRGDRVTIRPHLSRTMNIGRDGGSWGSPEHFDKNYGSQRGVWEIERIPEEYREVPE